MKNTSERLDIFLRNTLQAHDPSASPADWSEVEVLLKNERRPIAVKINRKIILLCAGAIALALAGFGIVKWAQHYSSLPSETEMPAADTASAILTATDSQEVISGSETASVAAADTSEAEIDSVTLARTERKADSLIADFKKKQAEEEKLKAENKRQDKIAQKEPKPAEKKNSKISSLAPAISDSDNAPDNILLPEDTVRKIRQPETKNDSLPAADSSKAASSSPKSKKGKKTKTDSFTPALPGADASKPDSLK